MLESLEEHHVVKWVLSELDGMNPEHEPMHPHPRSPDEPPGNLVAGAGAALLDKARDIGRKVVRQKIGSRS